jgi:NTP pyrophosphatase (non-canonical NTP hydrolase)
MEIRKLYSDYEIKKYGREWTTSQIAEGLVGDVGDLMKLVMAKEGYRDIEDVDDKLAHELSDCLWSVLVLSHKLGIDLKKDFFKEMDGLESRIKAVNN